MSHSVTFQWDGGLHPVLKTMRISAGGTELATLKRGGRITIDAPLDTPSLDLHLEDQDDISVAINDFTEKGYFSLKVDPSPFEILILAFVFSSLLSLPIRHFLSNFNIEPWSIFLSFIIIITPILFLIGLLQVRFKSGKITVS